MKNSRVLTGVLGVVLLLVWGRIGLQIARAVEGEEEIDAPMPSRVLRPAGKDRFEFPADVRDPFTYASLPPAAPAGKARGKGAGIPWMPPPLRLSGVVMEAKGSTALIESGDGAIHFLRQGDTLQGAKILGISSGVVAYGFRNKKAEWVLDQK